VVIELNCVGPGWQRFPRELVKINSGHFMDEMNSLSKERQAIGGKKLSSDILVITQEDPKGKDAQRFSILHFTGRKNLQTEVKK